VQGRETVTARHRSARERDRHHRREERKGERPMMSDRGAQGKETAVDRSCALSVHARSRLPLEIGGCRSPRKKDGRLRSQGGRSPLVAPPILRWRSPEAAVVLARGHPCEEEEELRGWLASIDGVGELNQSRPSCRRGSSERPPTRELQEAVSEMHASEEGVVRCGALHVHGGEEKRRRGRKRRKWGG
jgi:hypothetical protein